MDDTPPVVAIQDLGKRFGPRWAVRAASFKIAKRELVAFVGGNGSGKSTTLRMLAGLLMPDAGDGQVLGVPIAQGDHHWRGRIGFMAQRQALYPELTVQQILAFFAAVHRLDRRETVATMLDDFELTRFASARAETLSGGWARRLQFASATLHKPELLFLDEPTAGLDATARADLWRRIATYKGTVVISTHDMEEARQYARLIWFEDGRVRAG